MKFLKTFENKEIDIDFNDFDEEEFDNKFKVGDVVSSTDGFVSEWFEKKKQFISIYSGKNFIIGDIEKSCDVNSDSHGDIKNIPYDGYMVRGMHIDGRKYLVWVKMENLVKV